MTTQNLKELAQWDAGNHTTLLVRKYARRLTATFLRGDGTYLSEDLDLHALARLLAAMIESSVSHNTGSFAMIVDHNTDVSQGTVGPSPWPGPLPGGHPDPVLQAGAIDVHMQLRGLAEKVQLSLLNRSRSC